jgi:hypothetical protein
VEAKSQHLPEDLWFVMGAPSKGILMLKVCVSARVATFCEMIESRELDKRAERASRFCAC